MRQGVLGLGIDFEMTVSRSAELGPVRFRDFKGTRGDGPDIARPLQMNGTRLDGAQSM